MASSDRSLGQLVRRLPSEVRYGVSEWAVQRGVQFGRRLTGRDWVQLDYPPTARNEPRWMPHPELERIIGAGDDVYAGTLETIHGYSRQFPAIPVTSHDNSQPAWVNGWQPGLDSSALYSFLRSRSPALYLEIGSGTSTKFARRAIRDGALPTRIVSIDPHPRAEIDQLCDRVIRSPLEEANLSILDELRAGDVVFFDGSHRTFMNSDATVFFLEALQRVPAGVIVGIHDVYLPFDYPPDVADRYYSEQYLLAAYLLAGTERFATVLPAWYVSRTERFRPQLESLWEHDPALAEVARHGVAYWIETR
jgi:Methyltransferase domain